MERSFLYVKNTVKNVSPTFAFVQHVLSLIKEFYTLIFCFQKTERSFIVKQYIFKEYEFKEELGRGSYSLCRRCIYKENGKEYAVKVRLLNVFLLM